MKFVIEGRGLTAGGGKVGVLRVLPAMAKQGHHEYVAYLPDMPDYAALDCPGLKVVLTPRSSNIVVREWWLNASVRTICRKEKADALLCLGNFAPHFPPIPTVIRLQNAYYVYRDAPPCRGLTFRERLIVKYGREHFRHLAPNVTVIVQTEVMKQHLLAESTVSPSRVMVIPDRGMSFPESPMQLRSTHRDSASPFTFLCVALCSPNKNLEVLVDAVKKLKTLTIRPFRCLLTIDPQQHPSARKLLARIEREGVGDVLQNVGSLPAGKLSAAYGSADAFILPTLLESFGRPYDEAMHFRLPILTSDRDFARDRCRNAAVYFDPLDASSVAQAMAQVMENADLSRRLVALGQRVLADSPSWDEIAARFVDVLEHTARGENPNGTEPQVRTRKRQTQRDETRAAGRDDVRTLFNQKARSWQGKYGSAGKLNSRVEQFTASLAERCVPPARILDLGCGTGEIAAAIDKMGYQVTACDFAEEMMAIARSHHSESAVNWRGLEPDWKVLPFADESFDGIVASSVFEYFDDVRQVTDELSRVLRPDGIMLLTVPNPHNLVRKLEARIQSLPMLDRVSRLLRTVRRFDSYSAYLRLSKNRFTAQGWKSILGAAQFAPLNDDAFSDEAWRGQVQAPLLLLGMKRRASIESRQFGAETTFCRSVVR